MVPSRTHVSAVLQRKFDLAKQAVSATLAEVRSVAVTTDLWTSCATQGFPAFTGHFVDSEWKLNSVLLSASYMPENHTGENIAKRTIETLEDFGIATNKLVSTVHDQASNMVAAGGKISEMVEGHEDLLCAAHRLQLCVTHSLQEENVSTLLSDARALVGHFRRSSKATTALLNRQSCPKPKKLIQDCATRWNSQLLMLERLLELRLPVLAVLNDEAVSTASDIAHDLQPIQWKLAKQLVEVLKAVEEVTTYWSGES